MKFYYKPACITIPLVLIAGILSAQSYAVDFDGNDRYISIPHNNLLNVTNAFTVEAWIKTNSTTSRQVIAAKMTPTSETWLFELQPNGGGVILNLYTQTGVGTDHLSTSLIPANTWCHVAATYDGSQVRFYINGVADAVVPQAGNLSSNTQPLRIGAWGVAWGSGDERRFSGTIDEVRLWNIVRTAPEIKNGLYGTVSGSTAGLIAYYSMNQLSGQTVTDISANHLDGTLGPDNTIASDPGWVNSPVQYAANSLNFDSNDDYLLVPYNANQDMTNGLTMEAWVYPTDNGWSNIMMKGSYGYGFALSGSGGPGSCNNPSRLTFWDQSNCPSTIQSTLTYSLNTWQHVAVTIEDIGAQLRIFFYLDGVQDGPYFSNATQISNGGINQPLFIGTQGNGCFCNYFGGRMDDVRLWNTVRTSTEIAGKRNSPLSGSESGLVLLFRFDQGTTAGNNSGLLTAIDATPNNLHGTLTNFALSGITSNWVSQRAITLPVQLVSFEARKNKTTVDLSWTTAQEQNTSQFIIERSSAGSAFKSIGSIAAAGISNDTKTYHFTDAAPAWGDNYYRLKQMDLDERYTFSNIVKVLFTPVSTLTLKGNPVRDQLNATFYSGSFTGNLQLVITDVKGAAIVRKKIQAQAGMTDIQLPLTNLNPGVYYLQLMYGDRKEVVKFVKL